MKRWSMFSVIDFQENLVNAVQYEFCNMVALNTAFLIEIHVNRLYENE